MTKRIPSFILLTFLFCAINSFATTKTASVTGNWNNTATWGGVAVPGASDDIVVNTGITVTMTADYTTSATLTLNGTGTIDMAAYNLTIGSIAASGAAVITNSGATKTLTVGSDNTSTTYTGSFTGNSIQIVKTGSGTLTLSTGTSTFTYLNIQAGTVTITSGSYTVNGSISSGHSIRAAGTSAVFNVSGGTVTMAGRLNYGYSGSSGSGTLSGGTTSGTNLIIGEYGDGTLTISGGTHSYPFSTEHLDDGTATLTLSGGSFTTAWIGDYAPNGTSTDLFTINLNSGGSITTQVIGMESYQAGGSHTTTLNLNGGTITVDGTNNIIDAKTGGGTGQNFYVYDNTGGATINTNGYTATVLTPILVGTGGGITKSGTGTLVYSAANTYTSTTTVSAGTLKLGNTSALAGGALVMSGTAILDLNGYDNTISNITSSTTTSTITDNSAVAGTTTLNITALTAKISSLITNGATRTVALRIANSNLTAALFQASNSNTFSGGLTLANGSGSGTRSRVFNAITGSPFGSGTIYIGESATDHAGFMFDTQTNSISNALVFNTALGTDRPGIRIDNSLTITFSGTITANLANALFSTNGDGNASITGKITGSYGLEIDNTYGNATGIAVTLNNSGTANDYAGSTIVDASKCTLTLGAANQIPNGTGKGDVTLKEP